jgi:hypothetical protein
MELAGLFDSIFDYFWRSLHGMQTYMGWCTGVFIDLYFITGLLNILMAVSRSVLRSTQPTKIKYLLFLQRL